MFGTLRFALALLVVARHLVHAPNVGEYAVSSFFVLSGYLMTFVMHESYGYSAQGTARFWLNRILRLYPIYLAILGISLLAIFVVGEAAAKNYEASFTLPDGPFQWLANLTMVYPSLSPFEYNSRLSPTTWALTIELFFYLVISLGASQSKKRTFVWIGLGLAYSLYYVITSPGDFDRANLYYGLISGSLPFSLGSLLYFYRSERKIEISETRFMSILAGIIGFVVFNSLASAYLVSQGLPIYIQTASHFTNIAFSVLTVWFLIKVQSTSRAGKIDKWLGDLSYPIYLLHIQVGVVVAYLFMPIPEPGRSTEHFLIFVLATVITCAIAAILIKLIDGHIARVRDRIRAGRLRASAVI